MKKLLTLVILSSLLGTPRHVLAQLSIGNVSGNYNSTQTMLLNPSQVYPDRKRTYLHGWSYAGELNNNLVRFERPFSLWRWTGEDKRLANLEGIDGADDRYLNYLSTSQIFSLAFRTGKYSAFGLSTRTIQGLSLTGAGEALSLIGRYGLDTGLVNGPGRGLERNRSYKNDAFSLNTDNYQEISFTFGGTSKGNPRHLLKSGISAKLLLGFGAAHVSGRGLDFRFNSGDSLLLQSGKYRTGHIGEAAVNRAMGNPLGLWLNEINGLGFGMDIGFTYEFRPGKLLRQIPRRWHCNTDDNRAYRLRIGLSATDIGFITYSGASTREVVLNNQAWRINPGLMSQRFNAFSPDRYAAIDKGFTDALKVNPKQTDLLTTYTPASLNAQLDYNFGKGWSLGGHWVQNLRGKEGAGLQKMSQVSLVPRYEREDFEIGIPLSLAANYSVFNWGLYGRWGPFILGSDNMAGLSAMLLKTPFVGASLYGGIRFKINHCGPAGGQFLYIDPRADTAYRQQLPPADTSTIFLQRDSAKSDSLKTKSNQKSNNRVELGYETGDDCCGEVMTLRNELELARANITGLQKQTEQLILDVKLRDERHNVQLTTIEAFKKENEKVNRLASETRDENARLRAEIEQLRKIAAGSPCAQQTNRLDSMLKAEQQEKARLNAEIVRLRNEATASNGENTRLTSRIADLEQQVKDCRENTSVTGLITSLKAENNELRTRNTQLEAELKNRQADSTTISSDIDGIRAENTRHLERIAQLENDLNRCRTSGSGATPSAEINRLRTETANQRLRISELESESRKCGEQRAALTAEINRLKAENTRVTADLTLCRNSGNNSSAVNAEVNRLKQESDNQRLRIGQLEAELSKCGQESSTVKAEVNKLKSENVQLSNDLTLCRTSGASSTVTAEVNRLKKDNDDQRLRISQLETSLNQCGQESSTVKAEVNRQNSENSRLKAQVADLENKLKNTSGTDAEVNDLRLKNEQLTTQLEAVKAEYQFCTNESKNLRGKIAELESKLKAAESNTTGSSEIQAQVNTLKSENAELQNRLNAAMAEYKLCSDQSNAQKAKIAELEGKLKAAESNTAGSSEIQAQVNTLKKENSDLQTRMNELSAENKTLKEQSAQQLARVKTLEADAARFRQCCENAEKTGSNSEAIQNELNVLKQEYDQLRLQNTSNRDKARNLESEATALKARIAALENQLAECQKSSNGGSGEGSAPNESGSSGSRPAGEVIRNPGMGEQSGNTIRRPAGTASKPQSSGSQTNVPVGGGGSIRQPQSAAPAGRPAPGAPSNAPNAKPTGRPAPPSGTPSSEKQ